MGTPLNALEKSSSTASICCLSFSPLAWSSIVRMSCVSHDLPFRNPCWQTVKDVAPLKVGYNTRVDDMLKGFTHNRREGDWPVV